MSFESVKRLRVFLIAFILVFLMTSLPKLGVRVNLISPAPAKVDAWDKVEPKLEQKGGSNFQIRQPAQIISKVDAAGDYDGAGSYIVVDADTGEILESKNPDVRLPVASLTKIMTAVVSLDLASPDEKFSVSGKAATEEPTRLALTPGDRLSLSELLRGALLASANDCAQVIMEGVNQKYGDDVFVRAMNTKASLLGLNNTHFTNPQGFDSAEGGTDSGAAGSDDGNPYSSAHDLAILTQYALKNYPNIASVVSLDHSELSPTPTHQKYEYLNNWNGLLGVYPGVIGMKIGNTDKAGYTTVVVSKRDNHTLIAVLLGAPGVLERDQWTADLLDEAFSQYGLESVGVTEQALKAKYATWKYFN